MTNRGKQFRAVSPKKISRRKRTPRCDSCGKRDGEDAAGEGAKEGRKIRLKLCARCRGVAYCGMDCQKAAWKQHREVCVQYTNAAELPQPSPLVNHQIVGAGPRARRKVIYAGTVSTTGATPRQRENAPTRHPFFGRQESTDRDARAATSVPPSPRVNTNYARKQRELEQHQQQQQQQKEQQQQQQETQKEDGCPSPPTMKRLSMSSGGTRSRQGSRRTSRESGGNRSSKGSNPLLPRQKSPSAGAKAAAAMGAAAPRARNVGQSNTSTDARRLSFSPEEMRTRRSTYAPPNGVLLSRGSVSPPPVTPRKTAARGPAFVTGRRESAPLFPVALEDKRRPREKAASSLSSADASRRGPPPPYESVAHRAESIKKLSPRSSGFVRAGRAASAAALSGGATSPTTSADEEPVPMPPRLPPPTVPPGANFAPPVPPRAADAADTASAGASDMLARDSLLAVIAGVTHQQQKGETLGEREAAPAKVFEARDSESSKGAQVGPMETAAQAGVGGYAPVASTQEDGRRRREASKKQEGGEEKAVLEQEREDARENDTRGAMPGIAELSPAQDSAEGSAVDGEDKVETVRFPMDPPAPILPTSIVSDTVAAEVTRHSANGGVFDSCPSDAGVKGFAGGMSARVSPPHRSLSAGTVPNFNASPITAPSAGSSGATAPARQFDRRNSPRPRPPVSPGPAPLSQSSRTKLAPRSREELRAALGGGPATVTSGAAKASAPVRRASASPPARSAFRELARVARAVTIGGTLSPQSPPFVPVVELSPQPDMPTPRSPGPRPTETAEFYQFRSGDVGLPPPSKAYLGRPEGFSVHVLVSSAITAADLAVPAGGPSFPEDGDDPAEGAMSPTLVEVRWEKAQRLASGKDHERWVYYSFDERGRVAGALQPGDVVLLTPGRYEARAWGLQHLLSSVEIIGAGSAGSCVVYNNPTPSCSSPKDERYLIGVMGGGVVGGVADAGGAPEVKGRDHVEDDSDSGWEDGVFGSPASEVSSFTGRVVRVRLSNLTLEQGSGYRGTVYQLGRESHLEMDGCTVRCSEGGINIDQGTCLIRDSTISGSQAFGVHIGGEGTVEHCSLRDCGRGGGAGRGGRSAFPTASAAAGGSSGGGRGGGGGGGESEVWSEDDGTEVNRASGMPAISVMQSSRVRVRFNIIRGNAGHSLQCRDAPLPGGDQKQAVLARRAEAEAEEKLRSWLGSAAVLLREHLQEQHREGSVIAEGNQCQLNRACKVAKCGSSRGGQTEGFGLSICHPRGKDGEDCEASATIAEAGAQVVEGETRPAASIKGDEGLEAESGVQGRGEGKPGGGGDGGSGGMAVWNGPAKICTPTAEEEGLPLPAAMTLRFLAAMDEGYIGSMREENARLRRRRRREGGAG